MPTAKELSRQDGTLVLLRAAACLLLPAILSLAIVELALGGIRRHGPSGNLAWALLLFALFCLPMGTFAAILGGAKWLRNQRLAKGRA